MTVSVELVPRDKNILCQELQELKDNKLPVNLIKWEPHTRDFSHELGDQTSQYV